MRSKAWRLQQTAKKIAKRLKIIKEWSWDGKPHPLELEPHRLDKYNLNCGCKMCHYYKKAGNGKERLSYKDKKNLKLNK